ncbi:hypothetical protein TRV_04589 [Trichophyton verrucosum HKI 0517]|uniref:Uncharacterized protein n=1 Tax=Trichophyton verrucosum (strain HKI 0517) TaxID=663202 RepID=D4DBT8_TRIVH|nr:uncharacterized protein TRV_04589 [Trichophyton verrucosum HKI 0517]EFE40658.1 hypothetical protein TRV_04589 [Trichophyton verrucosum HKI 0517]
MHRPAALAPQLLLDGGQQRAPNPSSAVAGLDAELVQQRLFLHPDVEDVSSDGRRRGRSGRSVRRSRISRISAREEETRVGLPAEAEVERHGLRGGKSAAFDAGDLGEHGGGGILAEAAQVEDSRLLVCILSFSPFSSSGVVGGHRRLREKADEAKMKLKSKIDREKMTKRG